MMKKLAVAVLALLSASAFAWSQSEDYKQGFRDGFAEGQRQAGNNNNFGGSGGSGDSGIRILSAVYGSNAGQCDFTDRLARAVQGKTSYYFKPGNNWCGDPSNHVAKEARIDYRCNDYGRAKRITVPEGRSETLRCY
jgi:hypothetical protein